MAKPKIIVFGYDELLLASLDFFSKKNIKISAVVFPSNRNDWRIDKIRQMVRKKGYRILEQPSRKNISQLINKLTQIKPDIIYVWSYPMILPKEIINIPKFGCINAHMGLLPEYRGVNGVRWALLNNEAKTGVTIHFMDEGVDTGDIISKVEFPIKAEDDILSLMQKSRSAGLYLLDKCFGKIISGNAPRIPQDEKKARYYSAKMSPSEIIDWSKTNIEIYNLIRASVFPFPGVYTFWQGYKLVLREAIPQEDNSKFQEIGTISDISSKGIEIVTGKGNLLISKIEIDQKETTIEQLIELGLSSGSKFGTSS